MISTKQIILQYMREHKKATSGELVDEVCRIRGASDPGRYRGHTTIAAKQLEVAGIVTLKGRKDEHGYDVVLC